MNKKLRDLILVIVSGTVLFLFMDALKSTMADEPKMKPTHEVPLLLSLADKFKGTERPPVQFFHDRHAHALKQEGCQACHAPDEKGTMSYSFPKSRNEKNKKTLMNSYHKACIECHKEIARSGKNSGPVTCGKCHVVTTKTRTQAPWPGAEFDFYLHNLHAEASQGDCVSCHHTGDKSSCRDCHGSVDSGEVISYRKAAHSLCLKCHLEYEVGTSSCGGCHTGMKRSLKELAQTPRPNIGQPEQAVIRLNGAKMPGVSFNHKEHENYTTSCRVCHHKTMKNCNTCHTLKENPEGGNISLALAYHKTQSEQSCVGCHELKKTDSQCSWCHQTRENGLTETSCFACHRLSEDKTFCQPMLGDPASILSKKLPGVVEINILENKYSPVQFPHDNHVKKLTEISRKNKLSDYFHCNQMTLCMGCHHHSELYPAKVVPPCNTCHTIRVPEKGNPPALEGAFHGQCIKCHKAMKITTAPTGCNSGCHLPKKTEAAEGMITPHTN